MEDNGEHLDDDLIHNELGEEDEWNFEDDFEGEQLDGVWEHEEEEGEQGDEVEVWEQEEDLDVDLLLGQIQEEVVEEETDQVQNENTPPAPTKGMKFVLFTDLLMFYRNYAKGLGFQTRIQGTTYIPNSGVPRSNRVARYNIAAKRARLCCSKGGKFVPANKNPKRNSKSMKTGCKARLSAVKGDDGLWKINVLELKHNHRFNKEDARFMTQYREISKPDREVIITNHKAGISVNRSYLSLVVGKKGFENTTMTEKDCRNMMDRERRERQKRGDFMAAKKYLDDQVKKCKGFMYVEDVREDGQLRNLFWVDGRSREAYKHYGDVICFDTTFLKNRYKWPFAPFIGINQHGQTILLGCGLISGEETCNFVWLFEQWKAAMGGVAPKCIVTDADKAMGKAIRQVFPGIIHRLCLWHVMQNVASHLGRNPRWEELETHFKSVMHNPLTIPEFERKWREMIEEYNLEGNEWLIRIYSRRKRWVPIYFKSQFWAGMSTTQRSEGMNNYFRAFVNLNTSLEEFVEKYSLGLAKRVNDEARETFNSRDSPLQLSSSFKFERVFQKMYSNNKLAEIQKEISEMNYLTEEEATEEETCITFTFNDTSPICLWSNREGVRIKAKFHKETLEVNCECQNYEFRGIVCRHIFKVLQKQKIEGVPEHFILDRWRKDLPRSYVTFPIPEYTPKKNNLEPQAYQRMQSKFDSIAHYLVVYPELVQNFMDYMDTLKVNADTNLADSLGITVEGTAGVRQVFHRRRGGKQVEENGSESGEGSQPTPVTKDPPDKRGRGAAPKYRKGHKSSRSHKKRKTNDQGNQNTPKKSKTSSNPGLRLEATHQPNGEANMMWSQSMLRAAAALRIDMGLTVHGPLLD